MTKPCYNASMFNKPIKVNIMQQTDYAIGTQYLEHGKHPNLCTVVDVWKTYNSAGELVRTRYVTEHLFCGQVVRNHDVVAVTIARGIMRLQG